MSETSSRLPVGTGCQPVPAWPRAGTGKLPVLRKAGGRKPHVEPASPAASCRAVHHPERARSGATDCGGRLPLYPRRAGAGRLAAWVAAVASMAGCTFARSAISPARARNSMRPGSSTTLTIWLASAFLIDGPVRVGPSRQERHQTHDRRRNRGGSATGFQALAEDDADGLRLPPCCARISSTSTRPNAAPTNVVCSRQCAVAVGVVRALMSRGLRQPRVPARCGAVPGLPVRLLPPSVAAAGTL